MTRDDVLKEFYATPAVPGGSSDRMADEIVRLRAILAALREPSEAVKDAVFLAVIDWYPGAYDHRNSADFSDEITSGLNAAVAAAEREVR